MRTGNDRQGGFIRSKGPTHPLSIACPKDLFCGRRDARLDQRLARIAQHKQVEEELLKLAAIVESSADAIFSKSLDGIVLSWNTGAERLYGYSVHEMIGQPIHTIVPPERRQEWEEIMQRLAEGHRIEHFETVRCRKDGRRVDVSITVSPVRDANGKIKG